MASIRKRTWTSAGVKKQAWQVAWTDPSGKRETRQFDRKADAEKFRDKASQQVRKGVQSGGARSGTVLQAGKSWLAQCASAGLERTTIAAYEQHLRLHIVPVCGGLRVNNISKVDAEAIRDKLVSVLSAPMAKRVLRSLRAIGAEAERIGYSGRNVFEKIKFRIPRRLDTKVALPLKGELRALIRVAPLTTSPMTLPLVMLLIFCGMRASELRGLTWRALDLKRGTVTVSQRANARNEIGPPKSRAGYRTIPLPPQAKAALLTWKLGCPRNTLDLVFPSVGGKRVMSHAYMNDRLLHDLQLMAGIFDELTVGGVAARRTRYTLHDLRHAAASLWIEQRVSPKTIQRWMGHSSIQVTFDIYGHLFDQAEVDSTHSEAIALDLIRSADAT